MAQLLSDPEKRRESLVERKLVEMEKEQDHHRHVCDLAEQIFLKMLNNPGTWNIYNTIDANNSFLLAVNMAEEIVTKQEKILGL